MERASEERHGPHDPFEDMPHAVKDFPHYVNMPCTLVCCALLRSYHVQ